MTGQKKGEEEGKYVLDLSDGIRREVERLVLQYLFLGGALAAFATVLIGFFAPTYLSDRVFNQVESRITEKLASVDEKIRQANDVISRSAAAAVSAEQAAKESSGYVQWFEEVRETAWPVAILCQMTPAIGSQAMIRGVFYRFAYPAEVNGQLIVTYRFFGGHKSNHSQVTFSFSDKKIIENPATEYGEQRQEGGNCAVGNTLAKLIENGEALNALPAGNVR